MTNNVRGSSFLQARNSHHHRHAHLHDRSSKRHIRSHEEIHARQEDAADLDSNAVTQVVQTVSVVQVIDGGGNTVDVKTLWSEPQTNLIDPSTGVTLQASIGDSATTTPALPLVSSVLSDVESLVSPSTTPTESTSLSTTSSGSSESLTSAPLTTSLSSSFPTLTPSFNSTSSGLAASHPFSNATVFHSLFANTTTSTTSDSLSTSSSLFSASSTTESLTTSIETSVSSQTFTATQSATSSASSDGSDGSGVAASTAIAPDSTETASSSGGSGNDSHTPTGQVVGGVIGGLAGLAVLVLLAMLILRWKKRGKALLGGGMGGEDAGFRSLPSSSGPAPQGGGTATSANMAEQSAPFAVSSTLAALTGKRSSQRGSAVSSQTADRGFQRVSGRKLPSVLQYGGDGFTDPRQSTMTDATVYRDSMAFMNQPGSQRFALGSPMRPESGVPVMQPGAQRTPVTEQNPFFDSPPSPPSPPYNNNAGVDPLGRSLLSQDSSRGSRGSASRFTENI